MIEPRVRYSRQIRLPEIGEHGQARLSSTEVRPTATGFARVVESLYLAHAGVRVVEGSELAEVADVEDPLASLGLRHAAAREIADGAIRALGAIRGIVDAAARDKASS